jgi:PPOX class probable F420-dependent enzyme
MATNRRQQIQLSPDEQAAFFRERKKAALATIDQDGFPHVVAMNYFARDGSFYMTSYGKAQKVVNIRRNPRVSFMIEDGMTYDSLMGVSFEGVAEIHDDPDTIFAVGVSVWERYNGPYTDDLKPAVDMMMNKRVAVRIVPHRVRSWDHHKLGLPAMPVAGSTAPPQ